MTSSVRRLVAATITVVLAAVAPDPAFGFTPKTRAEVVRKAVTLMPATLQRQLRRHAKVLYGGALEGTTEAEGHASHAYDPGSADDRLADAMASLTSSVGERRPMREIVREFGRVGHTATDLAFALNVGPDDPREPGFYADFSRYVERSLPKIRVTFEGFADADLRRGDIEAFADRIAASARRDYEGILRSYHPDGRASTTQDFDDRSVAFASASLEFSLAVTATARAWLYAWHSANGDLAGAPLFGTAGAHDPFAAAPAGETSAAAGTRSSDKQEGKR
ncbi:MAG: hypothetical protein OEQ13_12415 [Acidobacteriota bacterium]|nr:hypothetical protein [Acidobacteriota bacterium]